MICIISIICAVICGVVANSKGRNVIAWTLLGLVFGLIPLIIVACLPNLTDQAARDSYVDEENRRLREQLRQERIKSESFRQHAIARLDAHDQHLGLNTRAMGPTLGSGQPAAGQLGDGTYDLAGQAPAAIAEAQWYYGRQGKTAGPVKANEIAELIRLQIVTRETLLWSESMSDWRPAGEVGAFAGQFD